CQKGKERSWRKIAITLIHRGSDCNCLLLQSSEGWTDDHRAAYPCGEWSTRRSTGIRSSGIGWSVSPPSCSVSRTSISQRTGLSQGINHVLFVNFEQYRDHCHKTPSITLFVVVMP